MLPVVLWSQLAGLVALLLVLAPLAGAGPSTTALVWGATAGVAIAVGLVVYFRGLARARMGVVTPITAVVTAAVPVGVGLLGGERPSAMALTGVLVAMGAVGAVSLAPSRAGPPGPLAAASTTAAAAAPPVSPPRPRGAPVRAAATGVSRAPGVVEALVAGGAFGLFFVCMDRVGAGAAVWPLVAANAMSLVVLAATAAVARRPWRTTRAGLPAIVASGLCGAAASLAFVVAVRQGLLSLVSVLAALSPVVTVGLARLFMNERLSRVQLAGLVAAVAGVGLIGAG